MPSYEFICPSCSKESEVTLRISEYDDSLIECSDCNVELQRHFRSAPKVNIPPNMRAAVSDTYYGKESRVPINIVDEKPDGSVRVTRIGKKSDIEND